MTEKWVKIKFEPGIRAVLDWRMQRQALPTGAVPLAFRGVVAEGQYFSDKEVLFFLESHNFPGGVTNVVVFEIAYREKAPHMPEVEDSKQGLWEEYVAACQKSADTDTIYTEWLEQQIGDYRDIELLADLFESAPKVVRSSDEAQIYSIWFDCAEQELIRREGRGLGWTAFIRDMIREIDFARFALYQKGLLE